LYTIGRQHGAGTNMAEQQKTQALPSLPQLPSKGASHSHSVDKENIDPFSDQQKAAGPGLFGVPPTKQQFGAKLAGNTRKPLQDITALMLAQQEASQGHHSRSLHSVLGWPCNSSRLCQQQLLSHQLTDARY
jgi:hypothetical protein